MSFKINYLFFYSIFNFDLSFSFWTVVEKCKFDTRVCVEMVEWKGGGQMGKCERCE